MIDTIKKDSNRYFKSVEVHADVIVIGAGLAGIAAALSAAREGKKTVLITDRPILGGSASSEIRIGPGGAAAPPFNRFARETGIIEEVFNHIYHMSQNAGKWRWFYFDQIYFDLAMSQENLTIYLNTSIFDTIVSNDHRITSIKGIQLRAETIYEFYGAMFIDCTGDGTIGYLSGAHYRMGREGKEEFHEVYSPTKPDQKTMGATLLFTSTKADHDVSFTKPSWATDIKDLPSLHRIHNGIHHMPDGSYYGFWWVEYGGELDTIHDDNEIILHLRKVVNGIWDYIKNSGHYPEASNQEMNWIGYLPGKRESRRLVGPYIVNAHDMTNQQTFSDAIGYTGWPIDIHPPKGYEAMEHGCTHDYIPGITDIPFRCLYSINIKNLLFAGRHISVTHEALGTLRLISTTAVMGQAVGVAASMCIDKNMQPNNIYEQYIEKLQTTLLRRDQSIIGKTLFLEDDVAKNATITVSSTKETQLIEPTSESRIIDTIGLILPIEKAIDDVSLLLSSSEQTTVIVECYLSDNVLQNYRLQTLYSSQKIVVTKKDWYTIPINLKSCPGKKAFIIIRKNEQAYIYVSHTKVTACLGINIVNEDITYETHYKSLIDNNSSVVTPCFMTSPIMDLYSKDNLSDGHIRPLSLPHSWISDTMKSDSYEWVSFDLATSTEISLVELVFNSDCNPRRVVPVINKVNSEMVKSYEVIVHANNKETIVVSESNNFCRFKVHHFEKIVADKVIIKIYDTWGNNHAELFDVRIF